MMLFKQNRRVVTLPAFLLSCLSVAGSAKGNFIYHIDVNTSAIKGTAGYLDFQFNPGAVPDSQAATATIAQYAFTGGSLASTATQNGTASGQLPGSLSLSNTSVFNEIMQFTTYGDNLNFNVTFSGPAVNSPLHGMFGSTFSLALLASDMVTPLLSGDPGGSVVTIDVLPDGNSLAMTYPPNLGGIPVATATPLTVPEPSSIIGAGIGMILLFVYANRNLVF